jgi:Fe-S-cluster-containing hydrogenase component 2
LDKSAEKATERREFLKGAIVGTLAIAGSSTAVAWLLRPTASLERPNRVVVDPTRCTGCRYCELVCTSYHDDAVMPDLARIQVDPDLNAAEWEDGVFEQNACRQCPNPECYYACPVGAVKFDRTTGARFIDEQICRGCKRCVAACPYHIVMFNQQKVLALKCDLCREVQGGPLCVKFCPSSALNYLTWRGRDE